MVKHQAYFDFLAGSDQTASEWQPVLAGLAALRLVDWRLDTPNSNGQRDWASFESVTQAVNAVNVGDPVRAILLRLIDSVNIDEVSRKDVGQALLAYGRALNFAGRWALACDVFASADRIAGAPANPRISIESCIARGAAARKMGDWDMSGDAYARAAHIASTVGDAAGSLHVEVGLANTQMIRGNLPTAEAMFDDIIEKTRDAGFADVMSMALHSRSTVALLRGRYAEAIRIGHEALEATTDLTARDAILGEIAAAFAGIGMHDAARDGYLIVAVTAQSQHVRWQATLNLMELAALDGRERDFNGYARDLDSAPLDPRLRAYYYIYLGAGQQRFGRQEEAEASVAKGLALAAKNQIHQAVHEAEAALAQLKSHAQSPLRKTAVPSHIPSEVQDVAAALSDLLKEAAASSS